MSVRSLNWLKFGGLVGLAFVLGLMFAGLLDLPRNTAAQGRRDTASVIPAVQNSVPLSATQPLTALSDAFATVAEQVRPSVVFIRSRRTEKEATSNRRVPPGFEEFFGFRDRSKNNNEPQVETGAGSGFVVSTDGYILTNNHVVDGADQVTVRMFDRREFTAKVVGADAATDIAVIKIDARSNTLTPAKLGSSNATRVGEWVLAVGNPLQEQLMFTVTSGIVSAKGRGALPLPGNRDGRGIQDFIQTDAAINRGNSGGPLLNVRGEVIGINSAIFSQTGFNVGYAFAIPIDLARRVMDQLIATGHVERAALGVQVQEVRQEDADYVKLPEIRGVKIGSFVENSAAERAGLKEGDIVINIDGQPVEYVAQLQQIVGFKKVGETVRVEVARKGGERKTFTVRLQPQAAPTELASRSEKAENPEPTDASEIQNRLGITVAPLTTDIVRELELPSTTRGVLVEQVDPYGPADGQLEPASSRPQIITAVEGNPVRNEADLRRALQDVKAGEIISLKMLEPGAGNRSTIVRVRVK